MSAADWWEGGGVIIMTAPLPPFMVIWSFIGVVIIAMCLLRTAYFHACLHVMHAPTNRRGVDGVHVRAGRWGTPVWRPHQYDANSHRGAAAAATR